MPQATKQTTTQQQRRQAQEDIRRRTDPIILAIGVHRVASANLSNACDIWSGESNQPEWSTEAELSAVSDALAVLARTVPTTWQGLAEALAYVSERQGKHDCFFSDEEEMGEFLKSLARGAKKLVMQEAQRGAEENLRRRDLEAVKASGLSPRPR